ncbi:MAG: glycosyltransferase family 1 protein [Erysipelotrichaceae bacterium]|nr:glycosyltransferase family 1 protein [Erysipelotrichaceae bacterium]
MIKLLIDARTLGSSPSGVGYYAYNFILGLHKNPDLKLILASDVCQSDELNHLRDLGLEIVSYGKPIKKSFKVFEYLGFVDGLIEKYQPDYFWEINNLLPRKMSGPNCKKIVTIHDVFPLYQKDAYGLVYRIYFRLGMGATLRNADILFYNSQSTKANCEKYFPKAKKLKNYISYIIMDMEEKSAGKVDNDYFLYVGNLEYRKGVDLLLGAFDRYVAGGGKKKLLLAGKIRDDKIEGMLGDLTKHNSQIEYLGYIDESLKNELYQGCSAFVFPSRAEGFGMPVIEASLYHKPVIISKIDVFEELMGDNAYYFKLDKSNEASVDNLVEVLRLDDFECKISNPEGYFARFGEENLSRNIYGILKENQDG